MNSFFFQNGGSNLCAVDDSNDHVLSLWDWQKEERLADAKVSRPCAAPHSALDYLQPHPTPGVASSPWGLVAPPCPLAGP